MDIIGIEYIVGLVEKVNVVCEGVDGVEVVLSLDGVEVGEVGVEVFWVWVGWGGCGRGIVLEVEGDVWEGIGWDEVIWCIMG